MPPGGVGETRRVEERRVPEANRFGEYNRPRSEATERPLDALLRLIPTLDEFRLEMRPLDVLRDRVTIELRRIELEIKEKFDFIGKNQSAFDLAHFTPDHLEDAIKNYILSSNLPPQELHSALLNVRIQDIDASAVASRPFTIKKGNEVNRLIIPITNEGDNANPRALVLTLKGDALRFDTTRLEDLIKLKDLATVLRATVELNQRLYADPTFPALNSLAFEIDMQSAHTRMAEDPEYSYTLAVGVVNFNSSDEKGLMEAKQHLKAIAEASQRYNARLYVLGNGRVAVLVEGLGSVGVESVFEKAQKSLDDLGIARNVDSRFVIAEMQLPLEAETTVETPLQIVNRLSTEAYGMRSEGRGKIATETDLSYERGIAVLEGAKSDLSQPAEVMAEGGKIIDRAGQVVERDAPDQKVVESGPGDLVLEESVPRDISKAVQLRAAAVEVSVKPQKEPEKEVLEGKASPERMASAVKGYTPHLPIQDSRENYTAFKRIATSQEQKEVPLISNEEHQRQQQRQQQEQKNREEDYRSREAKIQKLEEAEKKTWGRIRWSLGARRALAGICALLQIDKPLKQLTFSDRLRIAEDLRSREAIRPKEGSKVRLLVENRSYEEQQEQGEKNKAYNDALEARTVEAPWIIYNYFTQILPALRIEKRTLQLERQFNIERQVQIERQASEVQKAA